MHRLLTELTLEQLTALYAALPDEMSAALSAPIAVALKSRPQTIARRPESLRVKGLRSYLRNKRDDDLAGEILRAYLLGPRKELVTAFLDATGVKHEDGQVEDEDAEPAADEVEAAVKTLRESHDELDVRLYLQVAALQWPDNEGIARALADLAASA